MLRLYHSQSYCGFREGVDNLSLLARGGDTLTARKCLLTSTGCVALCPLPFTCVCYVLKWLDAARASPVNFFSDGQQYYSSEQV